LRHFSCPLTLYESFFFLEDNSILILNQKLSRAIFKVTLQFELRLILAHSNIIPYGLATESIATNIYLSIDHTKVVQVITLLRWVKWIILRLKTKNDLNLSNLRTKTPEMDTTWERMDKIRNVFEMDLMKMVQIHIAQPRYQSATVKCMT